MAAISSQHWRDRAIQQSEIITDIWQVWNSYAGRLAEIILFVCMVINIIEMLPGVALSAAFTSAVLGVQIVSLDIGGLSLSSMAHHARDNGATKAADMATLTSRFLIGLMIVTLVTVTVGLLYKDLLQYTQQIEKLMILVRIVMSVIYSSVIHSLRSSVLQVTPAQQSVQVEEVLEDKNTPLLETPEETIGASEEDTSVEQMNTVARPQSEQKVYTKKSSQSSTKSSRQNAQTLAKSVLKKYPGIGPTELAQRAQISKSYAAKIIAAQKGN